MADDMKNEHEVELHTEIVENEEFVEEAHDPENAEQQSLDSVDKAVSDVKAAPKRGTDQDNGEKQMPKTKGGMIAAAVQKMHSMNKVEMSKLYQGMMEGFEPEIQEEVDTGAALEALVEGEATLSEEFKEKTTLIFEAALRSKLSEEIDRLEESYKQELAEEVTTAKEEMVNKVDSYLNYVVESWMEENKVAIEAGIRTEIAENFMSKLKDVFVESYIEVPESKVDLVDGLAETVEELEEKYNQAVAGSMELAEEVKSLKRQAVIAEASQDMADTQVEKLNALLEGVDFDTEESFSMKVETIKESFFKKPATVKAVTETEVMYEDVESEDETIEEASGSMAHYLAALRKS